MMYLVRICQFKSLILLALTLGVLMGNLGCARKTKLPKPLLMNDFEPRWFKDKLERYQRVDQNGDILPHLFFDAVADYRMKKSEVNFVVTTPSQSEFRFLLDPVSGQTFMKEPFCEGNDLTKLEGGKFFLPNYHEGFVPQMLDQKLAPQRMIILGADELVQTYYKEAFFRAKIIGGILLNKCLSVQNCLNNFIEKSELVLVGVSKDDPKLKNYESVDELSKVFDWKRALATFLNTEGVFFYKDSHLPTVKSYQMIDADNANKLLKKNNKLFDGKIAGKLKNTCHTIHNEIETIMAEPNRQKRVANLKNYLPKKTKYYSLCSRLVQAVDPRKDHQLHDFYNILDIPYLLATTKNYFNCQKKQWQLPSGQEKYSSVNALRRSMMECSSNEFWEMFQMALPYSGMLKNQGYVYWRYIGYDDVSGGSHGRIDSWVSEPGTVIHCNKELMKDLNKRKAIYPKKTPRDFFNIYKKAP